MASSLVRTDDIEEEEEEEIEAEPDRGAVVVDDDDDEDSGDGRSEGGTSTSSTASVRPLKFSFHTLWQFTGPGFLMSIAYLDPGNIEADLQAGSSTGYTLLWVLFWATVMGLVLQTMAAKLGCCTGKHLAEHCADEFPRWMRYVLWIMAEIAIICVDCQEVIGTAIAIKILSNGRVPLWAGVLLTAVYTFVFLLMDRCIRRLEFFFALLITIMSATFGAEYFMNLPPQEEVLKGSVLPIVPSRDVPTAVGLIGAVIMPHNLYLHSALVLSRRINTKKHHKVAEAVFYNRIESSLALLASFVINMFVVCVFANCRTGVRKDDEAVGLQNAGDRLVQCMEDSGLGGGNVYKYVFALGLLASGQAATVASTYAGQYVMQGYLRLHVSAWKRALLSRLIAIGPGLLVGVLAADKSDAMQEWLNVVQSVQLPFAIIPLLYFTSSPAVIGAAWTNSSTSRVLGWGIAIIVVLANVYLVVSLVASALKSTSTSASFFPVAGGIVVGICAYVALVGRLCFVAFTPQQSRSIESEPLVPIQGSAATHSEELQGMGQHAVQGNEELLVNHASGVAEDEEERV